MAPKTNILPQKTKFTQKTRNLPQDDRVKKSLRASNIEGAFNSASGSLFSSYLIPFALFLRATSAEIGLLSAINNLAYTLSQIPGAKLTEYYSRKYIWVASQLVGKVLLWIPMVFLAAFYAFPGSVWLLIMLSSAILFVINLKLPAWTSLMGDIVPPDTRGRYFGRRNMITGIAGIAATFAGGYILAVYGFTSIFIAYILLSALSIPFFLRMHESSTKKVFHYRHRISFNLSSWLTSIRVNRGLAVFTVYFFFVNFAVMIASPFYVVYAIRNIGIDYVTFGFLVAIGALARIASFQYWGRLEDKFGSRKILIICAFFGIFTPLLWLFVTDAFTIALVNVFDGLVWSGLDLVAFNYLLDITPSDRRPQYVANHNFIVGIGIVLGALTGGLLAAYFEANAFWLFTGLQALFLLSFILRAAVLSMLPKISATYIEYGKVVPVSHVVWQVVAVEPMKGLSGTIHYTLRYPYEIEKKFKKEIMRIKYKIRVSRA